uniref:CAF1 family ribonuclease n=1 Tax=Caenorhabditis tropicalis TaxID=1561998 RepID=A0A1I7TFP6_9PELO
MSVREGNESESSATSSSKSSDTVPPFTEIQIIEVNRHNFSKIWPYLLVCIKSADFTAIDLELSGLGGKGLRSKDIEERYRAIRDAAHTRSILSFGISTMKLTHKSEKRRSLRYETRIFNILTLSEKPFTIEPSSLQFLAKHSFDFNRLIQSGVQFQGVNCPLKTLFRELLGSSSTLCLHNGFVDLAFLYKQMYDVDLPETLDQFINNLSDLFPDDYLPIADSKYLAEYQTRYKSSYLEYVFRRTSVSNIIFPMKIHNFRQGDNEIERQSRRYHIEIDFPTSEKSMKSLREAIEIVDVRLPEGFPDHAIPIDLHIHVCKYFSYHGFCHARTTEKGCKWLHDVDAAIDLQRIKENKKAFKRKRRYNNVIAESVAEKTGTDEEAWKDAKFEKNLLTRDYRELKRNVLTGLHRAGVDAFMTAFAVVYQQRRTLMADNSVDLQYLNRVPLSAKDTPLHIRRRQIPTKASEEVDAHLEAMKEINKMRDFVRKNAAESIVKTEMKEKGEELKEEPEEPAPKK